MVKPTKIIRPSDLEHLARNSKISRFDMWIYGKLLGYWYYGQDFSRDKQFPTRISPGHYYGLFLSKIDEREGPYRNSNKFFCPILWEGDDKRGIVYLGYSLPPGFTARASFKMFSWWNGYKEFEGNGRRIYMPKIYSRYNEEENLLEITAGGTIDRTFDPNKRFLSVDIDLTKFFTSEPWNLFIEFDKQYMRLLKRRLKKEGT